MCRCELMQEPVKILLMVLCVPVDGKSWSDTTRVCRLRILHRSRRWMHRYDHFNWIPMQLQVGGDSWWKLEILRVFILESSFSLFKMKIWHDKVPKPKVWCITGSFQFWISTLDYLICRSFIFFLPLGLFSLLLLFVILELEFSLFKYADLRSFRRLADE